MPQAQANGIQIEYETFGAPTDPAILLIMGLGGQLVLWPQALCEDLARGGFYVIRYDNRDVGLSSKIDSAGKPDLKRASLRYLLRLPIQAGYGLEDMAADALGLLDALGIRQAHVIGLSMGGMIGQILAARHAERLLSFTAIMTTSGNPRLPQPSLGLRLRLTRRPKRVDREALIQHSVNTWKLIGSPGYRTDDATLRAMVERDHQRCLYPRGMARQTLAIMAAKSRLPLLRQIRVPTLVIHGEADPLVPVAAGRELAKHIPGARLATIPGMGHDLPAPLLPHIGRLILGHVQALREGTPLRAAVAATA
ncbi:MAG: alpha/beta fold hydrolase [Nevskia sp.]|nr:alpha/beta fold hydrolase [Nevskia sp.]